MGRNSILLVSLTEARWCDVSELDDLFPTLSLCSLVGEEAMTKNYVQMCHFPGKRGNFGDKDNYRPALDANWKERMLEKPKKKKPDAPDFLFLEG